MTIGERIRALRHMHEYPQSFLAETVGIKKQTLYKYENDIITNIPILLHTSLGVMKNLQKRNGYMIFAIDWVKPLAILIRLMQLNLIPIYSVFGISLKVKFP